MSPPDLPNLQRALAAEACGTALLVAAVIGSGIMAERLAGGNAAIALLANTIATGAALVALISAFAAVSGAVSDETKAGVTRVYGASEMPSPTQRTPLHRFNKQGHHHHQAAKHAYHMGRSARAGQVRQRP